MRLILAAAASATLVLAAAPAMAQAPAPTAAAEAPRTIEQLAPELDGLFEQWMKEARAPGLIWGMVKDGRLVHLHAAGVQDLESQRPVGPDTLFRIASMSKAFTAAAIVKLEAEGKLSLDAPAETYVPEMRGWTYPTADSPKVTVRDLLNHTGGFVTDDPWGDRQTPIQPAAFTAMLKAGVPWSRAPGMEMEYSNFGYALLGRIVTNVSGRPYQRYVGEEILKPLGMTASGYDVFASPQGRRALGYRWENERWSREPDMADGEFGAMGGLQTSATDYVKWLVFLTSAWPARDGAETGPLKRASVREMGTEVVPIGADDRPAPGRTSCPTAANYGFGLMVFKDCELGTALQHGGGFPGYGSYMIVLPDQGTALFAFANRTYGGPAGPLNEAARRLIRAETIAPRPLPMTPALEAGFAAARRIWAARDVTVAKESLAENFLMDASAEAWKEEFARFDEAAGRCDTSSAPTPTGALSATFRWTCEKGAVRGRLLLAPTSPPTIQAFNVGFEPAPAKP